MYKWITATWERLFPMPTKEQLAQEHLQESYREYLLACRNLENDEHLVMMHATRIERLEAYLTARGVVIQHPMSMDAPPPRSQTVSQIVEQARGLVSMPSNLVRK